jgi:proteasome alpha subunit
MTEEPFRWVEAIANRREYIEHQLATGSPIAALTFRDGILLFTLGRDRQKIFEIYDRIAMGAIGHPGDIERLRMAAIEVTSAEGFTRSAHDVSLRRLANYSLSPALKAAFEQIYGAPYLARMLFAELGRTGVPNVFARLDYDGSIHTNGGPLGRSFDDFGVVAGTATATSRMEKYMRGRKHAHASLEDAMKIACDAWCVGHMTGTDDSPDEIPAAEDIDRHRGEHIADAALEAAVLDRHSALPMTWRALSDAEIRGILKPEAA